MEGNGANSRFVCYGKGLNELKVPNKFYFLVPSEFNDSGINTKPKGHHLGIEFEYLSKSILRQGSMFGRLLMILKSWWNFWKLLRKLNTEKEVLYFYGPQAFILGPVIMMSRFLGFKIIIENTEFQTLRTQESSTLYKLLDRGVSSLFEKNQDRLADHFMLISRRLVKFYKRKFPESNINLHPIIVDPSRFEKVDISKKTLRMGYLGSFGHKDGVPGIVKAFQSARAVLPDLKLRLIGYQIRTTELQDALDKEGISIDDANLEITGQVRASEIPQLLADCDLLLLNRINTPYANYGFATKLAEYMATGRPVITSDVSDVSYYFKQVEEIKIVPAGDSRELHDAILDRYNNYQSYNAMGLQGKEKALKLFSYQPHIKHLLQVCEDVMVNEGQKKTDSERIGFNVGERPESNRRPLDPQTSALTN